LVVAVINARRLAAMDMWGTAGTLRRRRVIRAEFLIGAIGCTLFGVFVFVTAGSGAWKLLGVWLVGAGINYVPLALYALSLSQPGALEAELSGVDVRRELRKAGAQQFWIVVPLAVAIAAVATEVAARRRLTHLPVRVIGNDAPMTCQAISGSWFCSSRWRWRAR
jgi:hypothetical protein